ncbi:hypothetical protein, partial [Glaesserella parasuis]
DLPIKPQNAYGIAAAVVDGIRAHSYTPIIVAGIIVAISFRNVWLSFAQLLIENMPSTRKQQNVFVPT